MRGTIDDSEASVALEPATVLGEGLHWDSERNCLWMVDIQGKRVIRWEPGAARWDEWPTPQRVGWVIPQAGTGALVLGLQEGFARARLAGRELSIEWIAKPFAIRPEMRLNDAKADASGALWAGSLNEDDESRPDGCLFRLGPDGRLDVIDTGYAVANGPAIRADGKLMLHTDSVARTIFAFDLDIDRGAVANKRIWKQFTPEEGHPDGMTFDAEGCVWIAHWGAGCISRFSADGALLRRIHLPASNVTNVCFGGVGLSRLFVTSARAGLDRVRLAHEPLAGALFEVDVHSVKGLPGCRAGVR